MPYSDYPDRYITFNDQSTKNLNVVVEIEGVTDRFSMVQSYTRIRYGDPGVFYGDPGIVYGGLRVADNFKAHLSVESNLIIGQRIEPEQGRGSVATMSLVMVDVNGYWTNLLSPGKVIDEPLHNKQFKVRIGYQQTSYPEDYFTVFRGYLTSIKWSPGKYFLQLSDANTKRRQQLFYTPISKTTTSLNNSQTTIPVDETTGYYDHILGPNGTYDTTARTYIQIDDEVMEYGPGDLVPTGFNNVIRNSRGTTAASHNIDSDVVNTVQLQGNAIDLALKIMLSGWNGPWKTNQAVQSIGNTLGGPPNLRLLILPNEVDGIDDLGLVPNDYIYITGSTMGNDGTYTVNSVISINDRKNNAILMNESFVAEEFPATTVSMAIRSQFDTLPIACGLKLKPNEVEVKDFVAIKNNFFSQGQYTLQIYQTEKESSGKEFLESQLIFPIGAYSVTRFGRISITSTKPPIADDKLVLIDRNAVIEPNTMNVERAVNNRAYFNEIQYDYDYNDAGEPTNTEIRLDTDSLSKVDLSSVLPIKAKGLRTSFNAPIVIESRGGFLVNRYRSAAIIISMSVNWKTGSLIEVGDVVLLEDNGGLQIPNFSTGERDLGENLFEAIDVQKDIKSGTVKLKLLSSLGYELTDRFGTISPSSLLDTGSTTTSLRFKDSFGALYPLNEKRKWEGLEGQNVIVHPYDWSVQYTRVFVQIDPGDDYRMQVSPALPLAPPSDWIIDIDFYPNNTDPLDGRLLKLLFAHLDPTVGVVSASDTTSFDVAASDVGKFTVGLPVLIHNLDYTTFSPERTVTSIIGNTITVASPGFGFVPSDVGLYAEVIGFIDGTNNPGSGGPYRFI